jgi:hypothetical protein
MIIHDAYGWAYPVPATLTAATTLPGTGWVRRNDNAYSGNQVAGTSVDANGYLHLTNKRTAGADVAYITLYNTLANLVGQLTAGRTIYSGFRVKNTTGSWFDSVMGFINDNVVNRLQLFSSTDLPGLAAGVEYWCTWKLDFPNGIIDRWVNGVKLAVTPIPAWMTTAVANNAAIYQDMGGYGERTSTLNLTYEWCFKDLYWIEYESGETLMPPGNITVAPMAVATTTATNLTPSTGTVDSVLKTAITGTSDIDTPVVSGPAQLATLDVGYTAPSLTSAKVVGVLAKGRLKAVNGMTMTATTSFSEDGTVFKPWSKTMTGAMGTFQRLTSTDKNVAGLSLTKADMDKLKIRLRCS